MKTLVALVLLMSSLSVFSYGQSMSAKDIIKKMNDNAFGGRLKSEMKMTIVRPSWTRTMEMKSWADGDDYSLILITSPAREKGISYLKVNREMWNFQPSIDRVIKMPPSMMMQSWMGSDFKNDDLVRQSSTEKDYSQKLLGKEKVSGRECYKIELIPNEDAPVVWGKILMWVDTKDYLQLKTEFYDEDEDLVNTMLGENITELGGRTLPAKMVLIPADEEGHKTIMEYKALEFDAKLDDSFFSKRNMMRVR